MGLGFDLLDLFNFVILVAAFLIMLLYGSCYPKSGSYALLSSPPIVALS